MVSTDGPTMRLNSLFTVSALGLMILIAGARAMGEPPRSLFDGKTLGSWKVSDYEGAGDAHVEDGALVLPFGERLSGVKWTGEPLPRMNYEIVLEARRVDGSDFFCGLTFPVNDEYASLIVGGWGGALCGISSINGDDAAHNDTRTFQKLDNGKWYRVRLRVTPTKLQAWLDDEKIVDVATSGKKIDIRHDIEESKPLGIASFQCTAALRNIRLMPIEQVAGKDRVSTQVWDKAAATVDARAELIRTLHEGAGFQPYKDKAAWLRRAADLREQVLIAAGLWPQPEKCPLNPVIHGKVDRGDFTVEKVYFQSYPGFFVSGNLYRPKGKTGPFPAILCPHGHWKDGRFNEATEKEVKAGLAAGWETDPVAARYLLQARCANLAKLGCIVFHYDMVGYADADPKRFEHRQTFRDIESDLQALSVFGLQTWDSIRSLDFVESLPDVDKSRIACTGASGGATQTFTLMAIEDRLAAAAPVSMISAGEHQGGCVCENNSLLRLGTDNVELAATFAPRPFIHPTNTGDWTKEFMEKGFPEIRATYALFDATDNARAFRQTAPHNYNAVHRTAVYNFFNEVLKLGHKGELVEQAFTPIAAKDLSVFDAEHPRPADAATPDSLKAYFIKASEQQIKALLPKDGPGLARARAMLEPALRHMLFTRLPEAGEVAVESVGQNQMGAYRIQKLTLKRAGDAQSLPALLLTGTKASGQPPVVVIAPEGKACIADDSGALGEWVKPLLDSGRTVLVVDVFNTGELSGVPKPAPTPPAKPIEFFAGYNRTTIGNRVHDVLTGIAAARAQTKSAGVDLVGVGAAGPWCLLARSVAGSAVSGAFIDADEFDFDRVHAFTDEGYLPASRHFGGIWPLAALGAPGELTIARLRDEKTPEWLTAAYSAAGAAEKLHVVSRVELTELTKLLGR